MVFLPDLPGLSQELKEQIQGERPEFCLRGKVLYTDWVVMVGDKGVSPVMLGPGDGFTGSKKRLEQLHLK